MVTVTNREDSTVSIEGWSEVETPWGMKISPLCGPVDLILSPGQTRAQYIHHRIPIDAPFGGAYIYRVRVGTFQVEVIAEDYFEFFIVPVSL